MNIHLTALAAALCLTAASAFSADAQEYTTPQVVVSTDKVRYNGIVYYSHVVRERQTLYSISKAYNVTLQEIYDANPDLHLDTEGLKKDQILRIPVKSAATEPKAEEQAAKEERTTTQEPTAEEKNVDGSKDYFIHRVKWFEDLTSIARKYMVSKESIMNINGMTYEKVRRKDEIKIPLHPEKWERVSAISSDSANSTATSERVNSEEEDGQTTTGTEGLFDGIFSKKKQKTSIAVLLPFNAAKKTDSQMMDFYSGVLLASKKLGEEGNEIDLNVYDVAGGTMPVTEERFSESDFVIGPVSNNDIVRAVNASRGKAWIVSPLDPRAESLADTIPNVIQAPAPTKAQISDMVRWVEEDLQSNDKVILVTQKGVAADNYTSNVVNEVRNSGLRHSSITFNILEGRQMMGNISSVMTDSGTNRVIIASDNKAFVIEVTRLLYLISSQKKDIVLYSTSKLRTFEEIDVEQLHTLNLHSSVSYYVDYDSKDVQGFLMKYRAIYGTEPSRTAFQGYDLMNFFTSLNSEHGRRWEGGNRKGIGLQSDFKLVKTNRGGYVNEAVRRIVYNSDYSVNLVRQKAML